MQTQVHVQVHLHCVAKGLEPSASVIRTYDVQLIPGLLQTPEASRDGALLERAEPPGDQRQAADRDPGYPPGTLAQT